MIMSPLLRELTNTENVPRERTNVENVPRKLTNTGNVPRELTIIENVPRQGAHKCLKLKRVFLTMLFIAVLLSYPWPTVAAGYWSRYPNPNSR